MRPVFRTALSSFALAMLIGAAQAAVTTITVEGTLAAGAADTLTGTGPAIFGATASSLAGRPFYAVMTVDDAGAVDDYPFDGSAVKNITLASVAFTVNGVSVDMGKLVSTQFRSSSACGLNLSLLSQNGVGNSDELYLSLQPKITVLPKPPSMVGLKWNSPCTTNLPTYDTGWSYFGVRRVSGSGVAEAGGALLVSKVTVSPDTVSAPIEPQLGMWWNPAESGTGYMLDKSGATMIVTTYSYRSDGVAQWYLSVGHLVNNRLEAKLETYSDGQCLTCAYKEPKEGPVPGSMVIQFTSPTTGTITLPGGRTTPFLRFVF